MFRKNQQVTERATIHQHNYDNTIDEIIQVLQKNRMSLGDAKELFEQTLHGLEYCYAIGDDLQDDYQQYAD